MATSSKYIQLSSSVLMEYVYADNSQVNVSGNPFRISTTTAPIWKMSNTHTNIDQILNSDSSEIISKTRTTRCTPEIERVMSVARLASR